MGGHQTEWKSKPHTSQLTYDPLPAGENLRILVLFPGQALDELVCELQTWSYKQSVGQYAAISYVWGDPTDTVDIICNGQSAFITVNLADALRQFRHGQTIKKLWVDSLCINQTDEKEKSDQVKQMGKVYQNAKNVLVWLGQDLEHIAHECFELVEKTNRFFDEQYLRCDRKIEYMPALRKPYPISLEPVPWSKVATLLEKPWFKRVWTVQECALAKECRVFWGSADIDIADIVEVSLWCMQSSDLAAIMAGLRYRRAGHLQVMFENVHWQYRSIDSWQHSRVGSRHRAARWETTCFVLVLAAVGILDASDPRDYIYAFFGCPYAKDSNGQLFLTADYTKSVDICYYNAACTLLQHSREGPWVLSAVGHSSRTAVMCPERPSWVPYWNMKRATNMEADPNYGFQTGGSQKLFKARPHSDETLAVAGFIFDRIAWKSGVIERRNCELIPRLWDAEIHTSRKTFIDKLWDNLSAAALKLGCSISEQLFAQTLVRRYRNTCIWDASAHEAEFMTYRHLMRSLMRGSSPSDMEQTVVGKVNRIAAEVGKCANMGLVLTEKGRLGLVCHAAAEVGDVCSIFFGATVPFVLAPNGNGRHRLVGESYIDSVMNGELLGQFEPTTIIIE
ncbi:hypothetical protein N0V86_000461 [Didymella sp. IMI 355093]|nr:hypothetical protein N0V86_000461 [Didymella sp. IMI 355093]